MPGPQASLMKQMTKLKFKSHGIILPTKWKQPIGNPKGKMYVDSFKLHELLRPFSMAWLFIPATPNMYHVASAKNLHDRFDKYIDGICDAVCGGIDKWRAQAKFKDLKVMSVSAIGAPGCLKGPGLANLIKPTAPKRTKAEKKYSDAVAKHVGAAWKKWAGKVMVPGLPWYPAFAAFPGPMAPPMPNVPMPLIACPSAMMSEMSPKKLKDGMVKALGNKKALHHKELFDSIGTGLAVVFLLWLVSQMIMNVMGKGPIPSFAPPYVPVGPVVGGDNLPIPGHLST